MGERRRERRTRRRIPCRLKIGGREYSGIALNLSRRGMFVQTNARPSRGEAVEIFIQLPDLAGLTLRASVARVVLVPPGLARVGGGGIGLRLLDAREDYTAFVDGGASTVTVLCDVSRTPAEPLTPSLQRFRVRVAQTSGPRSKTVLVCCDSEAEACEAVLQQFDEGWKILEVNPE